MEPTRSPAWIDTIPPRSAEGLYARLIGPFTDPASGRTDHILQVHSLHPEGLEGHLGVYNAAMIGSEALPRVEREMIGVVVSGINGCHY
jgi:alkylhydroperoxidase family enzyme